MLVQGIGSNHNLITLRCQKILQLVNYSYPEIIINTGKIVLSTLSKAEGTGTTDIQTMYILYIGGIFLPAKGFAFQSI